MQPRHLIVSANLVANGLLGYISENGTGVLESCGSEFPRRDRQANALPRVGIAVSVVYVKEEAKRQHIPGGGALSGLRFSELRGWKSP